MIAVLVELAVEAFAFQLDELALDLGRLRRRLGQDEYAAHLVDRCGGRVEVLDALVRPSAAEIFRANRAFCGDEQQAVMAALADVDDRVRHLRGLLGVKPR